jgi:hypothetical protein
MLWVTLWVASQHYVTQCFIRVYLVYTFVNLWLNDVF